MWSSISWEFHQDLQAANEHSSVTLSNKFKKFVELIRVSRIETDSKASDSKTSDSELNDSETSNDDKNDGNFMANYYKEAGKAGEEADKEVSFETEEAE